MSDGVDLGEFYRAARVRLAALASRPEVDPDLVVAATPEWRVRDVVAHVVGVAHDAVTGNMAGAPGQDWTAAQVERSRGRSIAELLAQWAQDGPVLEKVLSGANGGMLSAGVFDAVTHEADLRNAFGLPVAIPADLLAWAAAQMSDGFHAAVESKGLAPVQLHITDLDWFRGRLGRRTEDEVRAYAWSSDPSPYLDTFFIFGRATASLNEAP